MKTESYYSRFNPSTHMSGSTRKEQPTRSQLLTDAIAKAKFVRWERERPLEVKIKISNEKKLKKSWDEFYNK